MRKANKETVVALALAFFSMWVVLALGHHSGVVDVGNESVRLGDAADSRSGRTVGRVLRLAREAALPSPG